MIDRTLCLPFDSIPVGKSVTPCVHQIRHQALIQSLVFLYDWRTEAEMIRFSLQHHLYCSDHAKESMKGNIVKDLGGHYWNNTNKIE
jgi:hypothetical protein